MNPRNDPEKDPGLLNPYSDENRLEDEKPVDYGPALTPTVEFDADDLAVLVTLQDAFEKDDLLTLLDNLSPLNNPPTS